MLVGIIPKLGRTDALKTAREAAAWLVQRGHNVLMESRAGLEGVPSASGEILAARADLIVALGGDGTLIHAAGLCGSREVPILGINLGTLGFLTGSGREGVWRALELALTGKLVAEARMKFSVRVEGGKVGDVLPLEQDVLNDVVVAKNAMARIAEMEVRIEGHPVALYRADGLIVSTPTGSTAYSLSAGGPIVHPALDALVLTPICPHALTQRPLVLPATVRLEIVLRSSSEMFVTLDGQKGRLLQMGEVVRIERAKTRTVLLRDPALDHFRVIRGKLRWGER